LQALILGALMVLLSAASPAGGVGPRGTRGTRSMVSNPCFSSVARGFPENQPTTAPTLSGTTVYLRDLKQIVAFELGK
jgi:hypothetical protein